MRAVILAGGLGMRLRPYTAIIPKPLVPVGDRPILEHILYGLNTSGVKRVHVCLGHLGELIQAYFTQGAGFYLRAWRSSGIGRRSPSERQVR